MIKLTRQIKDKGYTVEECKKMWNYSSGSWSRHVNNIKYHGRIQCLIDGLPKRG